LLQLAIAFSFTSALLLVEESRAPAGKASPYGAPALLMRSAARSAVPGRSSAGVVTKNASKAAWKKGDATLAAASQRRALPATIAAVRLVYAKQPQRFFSSLLRDWPLHPANRDGRVEPATDP
jgi:hypothetical protein